MRTAGQETTTWQRPSRPAATVQPATLASSTPAGTAEPDGLPLLASKLTVPEPPAAVVLRPRLTTLLDAGTGGPVTLVAAPAGWGKTVLLSSWLAAGYARFPAVWMTVEPSDRGPRFWSYLRAALSSAVLPHHAQPPAAPPPTTADEAFLPRLAAAVAALPEPVVVILDDVHLVDDPGVLHGLEFLLRHGNGRLRLVIAARTEPGLPLHRWRLTGELTELRAADLAFTEPETAELIVRHGLSLPGQLARALHARTEGWAAGVRLAALGLRADPDPAGFVARFGGDQAGVAEYLTAELLTPLSPEVRDVLLRTAVLQRLCGDSADALTGRTDGERALATAAGEATGFVVPLSGEPGWYRCHPLVGDLLHAQLVRQRPDDVPELHRRAARWHAGHGLPGAALRHALAGGDRATAVGVLARHWPAVLLCGHDETLRAPLPAPAPDDTGTLLALAYAADRLDAGDPAGADEYLRRVDTHPTATPELVTGHVLRATAAGDLTEAVRRAHQLRGLGPTDAAVAGPAGVIAFAALGGAQLIRGEPAAAQATLRTGLGEANDIGYGCGARLSGARLALLHALAGQLRVADATARAALAVPGCRGRRCPSHTAAAHLALAVVAHERDARSEAARHLQRAAALATEPALAAPIAIVRAWLLQADGEPGQAVEALLAGRRELDAGQRTRHLDQWLCATEAELRGARGETAAARELVAAALAGCDGRDDALSVALARTHLRAGDPAAAAAALPDWSTPPHQPTPLALRLESGLVEALAAHGLGDQRRAHQILERVLELAEPDGHRRVFTRGPSTLRTLLAEHLDRGTAHRPTIDEVIAATDRRHGERRHAAPAEPLTERELTILRYLQSTLSNGEIAAELFLSVNTVKTHVRNIYQKLGAPRRREAVRRARELRLL
ncbi:LuxR family transcriptional regulator, maltose regulon positive regulatory protein [Micromonospora pattaloongensis]|uniref:LuxR family transcriptional regulator, maltose regulon positive regulatory protein n=1 Tax=Micromonospora pattaloongensis TaxID=405436 RepID=A0A1H3RRI6_9ACTN|nr:LuxR C-terminal-related transcriptional regulator [Micromonospora pattaloongensis]SDZ28322.1 LuxR family transcriptional regulator, maltose regulon positive regulatory protein [Micromonospora pattaloongensis]